MASSLPKKILGWKPNFKLNLFKTLLLTALKRIITKLVNVELVRYLYSSISICISMSIYIYIISVYFYFYISPALSSYVYDVYFNSINISLVKALGPGRSMLYLSILRIRWNKIKLGKNWGDIYSQSQTK